MKKYLIVLVSLIFVFNMSAQTAEDIFKLKFPELSSSLKPFGSTNVNNDNIELFRAQYKKLQTASEEIEMFKFGGFPVDGGEIFEEKELKSLQKDGQLVVLENIVNKNITDMKLFLSDKHKWGVDSVDCIQNYSNFKMRMKQKDYKAACGFWRDLMAYYPMSYKGVYSNGDKLMRIKIKMIHNEAVKAGKAAVEAQKAENFDEAKKLADQQKEFLAEKELWIDTLIYVVDQRIKYFGNSKNYGKCYLEGKKGSYIYKYRKDTALTEAYELLKGSVECEKEKAFFLTVKDYFDASYDMTVAKNIGADVLVNDYNTSTGYLKESSDKYVAYIEKEKKKSNPSTKKIENWEKIISNNATASKYITSKFASSEFSKCEFLIPAFKAVFEENKTNAEWLEKILGILKWKECTKDPFFLDAAKELYKLKPSANSAVMIAIGELKEENYSEAAIYFEKAYTEEEDVNKKAEYYYLAAFTASLQGQKSKSRTLALKAAGLKENYAKPYILIAKLYASTSCGDTPFDRAAVYWVAVDKLYTAKSISKDEEELKEIGGLIGKYSSRFPKQDEGFMRSIYEGNSFSVGCWIGETTKARY